MEAIQEKLAALPQKRFAAGEVIIPEGEEIPGLYFLMEGTVEIAKGGVAITEVNEVGAVFGEMSMLLSELPTATVRAKTDCKLQLVESSMGFLIQNPEVSFYIASILAQRLDSLNKYLVDLKRQFADRGDHLGLVSEILDGIMTKHPRKIEKEGRRGMDVD